MQNDSSAAGFIAEAERFLNPPVRREAVGMAELRPVLQAGVRAVTIQLDRLAEIEARLAETERAVAELAERQDGVSFRPASIEGET